MIISGRRSRWLRMLPVLATAIAPASRLAALVLAPTVLPPFVVEESTGRTWTYAETPEFQILSRWDEGVTRKAAEHLHRLHQLLALVLPDRLAHRSCIKATLMLYDRETTEMNAKEARRHFRQVLPGWVARFSGQSNFSDDFTGSQSFFDEERLSVLLVAPPNDLPLADVPGTMMRHPDSSPAQNEFEWSNLTPGYMSYLVADGESPLPAWFSSGFMSLYRHLSFNEHEVLLNPVDWPKVDDGKLHFWGKAEDEAIIPLAELFASQRLKDRRVEVWLVESELFIRWAATTSQIEALGKFVEAARTQPATEALFQACFHQSFHEVEGALLNSLPRAQSATAAIEGSQVTSLGRFPIRPATREQIARVKGGFELLEAHTVLAGYPEISALYLGQAETVLRHGHESDPTDLQINSDLGVCLAEQGKVAEATPFLEEAVRGHTALPRPYFELARTRLVDAMNRNYDLTAEQVDFVLAPIRAASARQAYLAALYEVAADAWAHTSVVPTPDDIALLREGVSIFPASEQLPLRTAKALVAHHLRSDAQAVVRTGLRYAPTERIREQLENLSLEASPSS